MEKFMSYRNYPLVRQGNTIFIGYMCENYVVQLQIMQTEERDGIPVATKVRIYQMSTDEKRNPIEAIVKNSERSSLYDALDVAVTWLERANKK